MLQAMRHMAQSWLFKGLMLILAISFSIWGVGDIFRGNPLQNTVAKAGSATITVQDLNREFEKTLMFVRGTFGQDITAEEARKHGLLDAALNNLIKKALMDQAVKKMGLDVSAKMAFEELASQGAFHDKSGHFDPTLLNQYLAHNQISEADFEKDIARTQVTSIFAASASVPDLAVSDLVRAMGQKRTLDVAILDNKSLEIPIPEDDKILKDYFEQNPKLFTAPEYRSMSLLSLSTDDIAKSIVLTDDQVEKEYNNLGDKMVRPARRDVVQVVLQNEDKAKKLADLAKSTGQLIAEAKKVGFEAVPLKQVDESALFPELAKPVFAAPEGAVVGPIKSSLGWHVLSISKIYPAGKPTFNEAKDELRRSMQHDQAIEKITQMVNKIDDELAANHSLEDIASSLDLTLIHIPAVDSQGKTADNKDGPGPNAHADLLKTDVLKSAFSQASGETSPILDDKNGNYIVVRTDDITVSAVRPYDSVKDDVKKHWLQDEQAKAAKLAAEKLAKDLSDGATLASLASHKGVTTKVSKPISGLGDSDPDVPNSGLPQIMKMKKGEAIVLSLNDHQIVLRLAGITEVNPESEAAERAKVAQEIRAHRANELLDQYDNYLHKVFSVTIDRDAMESVSDQGG